MNNCPEMPLTLQLANDLSSGPVYLFADWPNVAVSTFGAGAYTIWHSDGRFIYVGMSGRGITTETSRRIRPRYLHAPPKPRQRTPERRPVLRLRSRPACPSSFVSGRHHRYCVRSSPDGCICAQIHPREPLLPVRDGAGWSSGLRRLKLRSSAANGSMAVQFLNPRRLSSGVLL